MGELRRKQNGWVLCMGVDDIGFCKDQKMSDMRVDWGMVFHTNELVKLWDFEPQLKALTQNGQAWNFYLVRIKIV